MWVPIHLNGSHPVFPDYDRVGSCFFCHFYLTVPATADGTQTLDFSKLRRVFYHCASATSQMKSLLYGLMRFKVAGIKVYPRPNLNNRAHAVTACIGLWHHRAITWLLHALTACIGLWCHGVVTWLLHALTAWDLKFQVCLRYTFTAATLYEI